MKHSLKAKFILSYLAVALVTVLVVSALIRLTSGQSLMNMIVEEQTSFLNTFAEDYFATNASWDGFFQSYSASSKLQPLPEPQSPPPDQPGINPDDRRGFRGVSGMIDTYGQAILPTFGYEVGALVPEESIKDKIAVEVNDEVVAYILPDTSFQFRLSAEEQAFLQRTTLAITITALASICLALAIGYLFANQLLKPIRQLTAASQKMAHGELGQQVPVTSKDELGELTASFNQMSSDLDLADQQRKRITADITHDLSTPIQIISGYVEMMEDGAASLAPQRVQIIQTELDHLRRLVTDLSLLTQVEAGALEFQLESLKPADLIEPVFRAFQPIAERQGVKLELAEIDNRESILVDGGRMKQVLTNLLENSIRHTPQGGEVRLGVRKADWIEIWVKDSGQGIAAKDLNLVFDRFYRADEARSGNNGKMGLGLSICKALVQAQGGKIIAQSEGLGFGTQFSVFLPTHKQI